MNNEVEKQNSECVSDCQNGDLIYIYFQAHPAATERVNCFDGQRHEQRSDALARAVCLQRRSCVPSIRLFQPKVFYSPPRDLQT